MGSIGPIHHHGPLSELGEPVSFDVRLPVRAARVHEDKALSLWGELAAKGAGQKSGPEHVMNAEGGKDCHKNDEKQRNPKRCKDDERQPIGYALQQGCSVDHGTPECCLTLNWLGELAQQW